MAVAIAALQQASNTFSPIRTGYEDFDPVFGQHVIDRHKDRPTEVGGFLDVLEQAGISFAPIGAAWANPANRPSRVDFDWLVSQYLTRLNSMEAPSALLLALHGAQAAQAVDDASGYFLRRLRKILGSTVPVIVTLDLHANVTRAMVEHATAIIGHQAYPHGEYFETGRKAARLAVKILRGEITPVMSFVKLPLIVPLENMQTTTGPMHRLLERGRMLEDNGYAESVSVFGAQPWLDVPELGGSVVVVTDDDRSGASRYATTLARQFWNNRRRFDIRMVKPAEAVRRALKMSGGPIVLTESADSPGCGAPGDSTALLQALLETGVERMPEAPAAIFLVDPAAVSAAIRAGVGSVISIPLGAKGERKSGGPVALTLRVRLLSDGRWTSPPSAPDAGIEHNVGRAAVLETGSLRILGGGTAGLVIAPELYRSHGIEPTRMKILGVKSPSAFRTAYEPFAKGVLVLDTPGSTTADLASLPYRRVMRPL